MIFLLLAGVFASGILFGWAIFYPMGRKDVILKGPTDSEFNRYLTEGDGFPRTRR